MNNESTAAAVIGFITQKGFSGTCGIIGARILWETDFAAQGSLPPGVIGAALLVAAAIIEYKMWEVRNRSIASMLERHDSDKRRISEKEERLENLYVEHLNGPRG